VRISGFNWVCVCRYEVERGADTLTTLSVKSVGLKNTKVFFMKTFSLMLALITIN